MNITSWYMRNHGNITQPWQKKTPDSPEGVESQGTSNTRMLLVSWQREIPMKDSINYAEITPAIARALTGQSGTVCNTYWVVALDITPGLSQTCITNAEIASKIRSHPTSVSKAIKQLCDLRLISISTGRRGIRWISLTGVHREN